jgi:hypothetical protein
LLAKHFPPHDGSRGPDLYGRGALKRAQDQKQEIAMNRTAKAVVFMFVVLGLVASVALANSSAHNKLTAMFDGSQPPVPPKAAFLDGSQPPVPPKAMQVFAQMLDGSQSPVPPKMTRILDGSQPPVPPKKSGAVAWMYDGSQSSVPPKALGAAV